jgi:hypothetical protein
MVDKEKKLKKLVERSRELLGDNLKSVVLYGSAATGEYIEKYSDLNTMIVLEKIDHLILQKIAPFVARWCKRGNPPPLLMTLGEIETSGDVFPMEFLDIKECHRVLYGEDPLSGLDIDVRNLRLQCEHELKGKIIRLREQFLLVQKKEGQLKELIIHSLSTFVALFRGALRLLAEDVPMAQRDVLHKISELEEVDLSILEKVLDLKEGRLEIKGEALRSLFGDYLLILEKITDKVDTHLEGS